MRSGHLRTRRALLLLRVLLDAVMHVTISRSVSKSFTPLFRDSSGLPFSTDYVRQRLRRAMSAPGRDGSDYGVHFLEIDGELEDADFE